MSGWNSHQYSEATDSLLHSPNGRQFSAVHGDCEIVYESLRSLWQVVLYIVIFQYINGLVQDCSISIANAMEILQSYTKPLIFDPVPVDLKTSHCSYHPRYKVHGANMGPTWVLTAPYGPHEPCYQGYNQRWHLFMQHFPWFTHVSFTFCYGLLWFGTHQFFQYPSAVIHWH